MKMDLELMDRLNGITFLILIILLIDYGLIKFKFLNFIPENYEFLFIVIVGSIGFTIKGIYYKYHNPVGNN